MCVKSVLLQQIMRVAGASATIPTGETKYPGHQHHRVRQEIPGKCTTDSIQKCVCFYENMSDVLLAVIISNISQTYEI